MTTANPETMPSIQGRIVEYDRQDGRHVVQQRFYEYNPENEKWHQLKNVDAREMFAQDVVNSLAAPYADVNTTVVSDRPKRTTPLVAEPLNNVVDFKKSTFSERHPRLVRGLGKVAASVLLMGVAAGLVKSNESSASASVQSEAVEAVAPETNESSLNQLVSQVSAVSSVAREEAAAARKAAETKRIQAEMELRYAPGSTGEHTASELGFFEIDLNNAEKSLENLGNELRRNRAALAFWNACLATEAPSFAACVEDLEDGSSELTAKYAELLADYTEMEAMQYGTIAESLIAKFEQAYDSMSTWNGIYKTVAVGPDGKFIPATNTRFNDPRMNFKFEFNGKVYNVQLRSCVQLTEGEVPTPPEVVTPPEEETPPTTVPPTTTTTVPETTTTTAPTTTTTEATTTTTEATTTTSSTTSTTTPSTTSTEVTLPKPPPTQPEGEVTTTVTAGDPTPPEPTTSTVPPSSTESTAPADTATSTTAPEAPVDNPPVNSDSLFPFGFILGTGGIATVTLAEARKRKERKYNEEDEA